MGRSIREENDVEREEEVPHVDGRSRSSRSCSRACAAIGRSRRSAGSTRSRRTLYYSWRDKLLEGGAERLAGKEERTELVELRKRVRELERTLGRKTYELEILGNGLRAWE